MQIKSITRRQEKKKASKPTATENPEETDTESSSDEDDKETVMLQQPARSTSLATAGVASTEEPRLPIRVSISLNLSTMGVTFLVIEPIFSYDFNRFCSL